MEKIYGAKERQDSLVKVGHSYYLYYGFGKDSDDAEFGYNYREKFDHTPTADEIRSAIIEAINAEWHEQIVSRMKYEGYKISLSTENQLNYSMFNDVLGKSGGSIIVKVTDADGNDKNITFDSETFSVFYAQVQQHIKDCLQACWKEKEELDLSCYLP